MLRGVGGSTGASEAPVPPEDVDRIHDALLPEPVLYKS
jgi:hypothetical protein